MHRLPSHPRQRLRRACLGVLLSLGTGVLQAQPWQELVQPIGTMVQTPPQSATEINALLISQDPNLSWATAPFAANTDVTRISTIQPLYFVRFYNPNAGSGAAGSWIMRSATIRGLSRAAVRNLFALPADPTHMTIVKVPAGHELYTGIAAPIAGWGKGGGQQSKLISPPYVPLENFMNQQSIGDCILCYRVPVGTGNPGQVAQALDRTIPAPYSPLETLYTELDLLYHYSSAPELRQALHNLSGEGLTGAQTLALNQTALFLDNLQHQASTQPSQPGNHFWASSSGQNLKQQGLHGNAGLSAESISLQLGWLRWISPDTQVGFSLETGNSHYRVRQLDTHGQQDSAQIALHVLSQRGPLYIQGAWSHGHFRNRTERQIVANHLMNQQHGNFSSHVQGARIEAGYRHNWKSTRLTPYLALEPAWLRQAAFQEQLRQSNTNGTDLGLQVKSQHQFSLPLSLGLTLENSRPLSSTWRLASFARIEWQHEFKRQRELEAALTLLPQQPFQLQANPAARDSGRLSLGFTVLQSHGLNLALQAELPHTSHTRTHTGSISLLLPF